jgi:D-alanine-D-alanine ligase
MLIGFTYDLREDYRRQGYSEQEIAEFERTETIDAIESILVSLGHQVDRIGGIQTLTARLAAGHRWELVFNLAEGMHGFAREAQVPALLDAFGIPYTFSDALVLALTLHKAMTKRLVRSLGIATPDFRVVESAADAMNCTLAFPVFAKPVASGSSIGISSASKAQGKEQLASVCRELLQKFNQPVLVETFLPGRELTVGITGTGAKTRAVGVLEVRLTEKAEPGVYSYANKTDYEDRVRYSLATDATARAASDMAVRIWRELGCRDAGRMDFRCDANENVHFLEVNPLAGLDPVHSDLSVLYRLQGVPFRNLFETILASAMERVRR